MTTGSHQPTTWFAIITRPASHLLATVAAIAVFAAGILLGTYVEDLRIVSYGIGIVVLFAWYLTMTRMYQRARRHQRHGISSR